MKIAFITVLNPILKECGVVESYERFPRGASTSRPDAVYDNVVIEFKAPGNLTEDAVKQVRRYIVEIARREREDYSRYVGVVTDGISIEFVRYQNGKWVPSKPEWKQIDGQTLCELLKSTRSIQRAIRRQRFPLTVLDCVCEHL